MSITIDAHCVNCGVRKPKSSAYMEKFPRSERTLAGLESTFLSTSGHRVYENPMVLEITSPFTSASSVNTEDWCDVHSNDNSVTDALVFSANDLSIGLRRSIR